jgi:hypothetical protein
VPKFKRRNIYKEVLQIRFSPNNEQLLYSGNYIPHSVFIIVFVFSGTLLMSKPSHDNLSMEENSCVGRLPRLHFSFRLVYPKRIVSVFTRIADGWMGINQQIGAVFFHPLMYITFLFFFWSIIFFSNFVWSFGRGIRGAAYLGVRHGYCFSGLQ